MHHSPYYSCEILLLGTQVLHLQVLKWDHDSFDCTSSSIGGMWMCNLLLFLSSMRRERCLQPSLKISMHDTLQAWILIGVCIASNNGNTKENHSCALHSGVIKHASDTWSCFNFSSTLPIRMNGGREYRISAPYSCIIVFTTTAAGSSWNNYVESVCCILLQILQHLVAPISVLWLNVWYIRFPVAGISVMVSFLTCYQMFLP